LLQNYSDYHLVLLDDGCQDGTAEMVQKRIPAATVLRGNGDWWWGGALHQGYLWLRKLAVNCDAIIVIMNDDTRFDPDFISNGVSFLQKGHRTLLMAEAFDDATKKNLDRGVHVDWDNFSFQPATSPKEINCLATRGLFLKMSDFLEIGGFHPVLLPHYLSDYEFTIRAYSKGMKLCTDPSVMLLLDAEKTGLQAVDSSTFRGVLRSLFSLRSANNLRSWIFFILLACPLRYVPRNLLRTCLHACKAFSRSIW
jgi:GT2 family glycosyltransferase